MSDQVPAKAPYSDSLRLPAARSRPLTPSCCKVEFYSAASVLAFSAAH